MNNILNNHWQISNELWGKIRPIFFRSIKPITCRVGIVSVLITVTL